MELTRFIQVLQLESQNGVFLTKQDMAERFSLALVSVAQYIYRARRQGVDIQHERGSGYYIPPSEEEPTCASRTDDTSSTAAS